MIELHHFTFSPLQENTYLLINEKKECIIIDPGCYFQDERKEILQYIQTQGLIVTRLLNTHCHLDHIFGNKLVSDTYKVRPEIHPNEQTILDRSQQAGAMYNLPFDPSPMPGRYLEEGEIITFGDNSLKVLLTPGHSPGSVSFYCEAQKFVIAGDVLFYQSIGRTDLPGGDHQTLLNSIHTQLFVLPDDVKVYSGHGPATFIGAEKKNNPFLQ
ncbi:glyoxylase-like metal-dependent hydrolase (beta-lactamase superfamily II) [Chitinophaga dinghuensis]|uniref:Glyoxylase-like metal-dependent hydrolase (Beta-lactamase superfamily II) n=1 Tax=Chitinophaga dinghuensis TaxID=1539050 RepID=A0A327VNZ6_9BACT|nr:MBL fold metallo-hydrolase [Chitinophaga dinghuensis]RAJ75553.1 glyoxylase-like metal-dependent hydrolase (beta-lactamase superfamily II) [Chitinophaga dinghuensis]